MNTEITSLATALASSLESPSVDSTPNDRNRDPLSTVAFHRAGRVLFACHAAEIDGSVHIPDSKYLADSFDFMVKSLPSNYVRSIILNQLHRAYATLILSFASSAPSSSPITSALKSVFGHSPVFDASNEISWNDVMEGTESLCGIYLSSPSACRVCAFSGINETSSSQERSCELELFILSMSWVYDYISSLSENDKHIGNFKKVSSIILETYSSLLVYGIVSDSDGLPSNNLCEEEAEAKLNVLMNLVQSIQSSVGDYSYAMGDMLDCQPRKGAISFVDAITSTFAPNGSQPPQLQYLLAMLRSSPRSSAKPKSIPASSVKSLKSTFEAKNQSKPKKSMTDIHIENIHSILPTLGEGYIEEALKCYNHDVERTIEALLQVVEGGEISNLNGTSIHPRLITLPTNLPRKLRDLPDQYAANVNMHRGNVSRDDGREHVERQKEYWKHVERQAEEEAYLVENVSRALGNLKAEENDDDEYNLKGGEDEYDDDYDDQYDGIGDDGGMAGGIGGMDEGLYDVDIHNVHMAQGSSRYDGSKGKNEQDMWRKYNRLVKDVDAESQFWEENRNMNRESGRIHSKPPTVKNTDEEGEHEESDVKNYRGPDKGKGGRLIGPDGRYLPIQRGGKKGRGGGGGDAGGRGRGDRGGRGGRGTTNVASNGNANNKDGGKRDDGELSKIQKRRKNDNKAKIGNHHRKDRATKKASGGMVI
ncbi:hypothetical protein ACHAXS_002502 [Conticribra weissflogii]